MIKKLSFYTTDHTDPYKNLAIEEYLTFHAEQGECILFLWQNRQTVVIGKNQNAWKECKVSKLEEDGGNLVRRLSGGGAVFHDLGNLNFTFCVRAEDYDIKKQTEVILQAVNLLGMNAEKTGRNDIVINGRKFSGHAYYKAKGFCYHHGTLLVDVDQNKMAEYLYVSMEKLRSKGVDSVRSRTINLKEVKPDLTIDLLKEKLLEAFGNVYEGNPIAVSENRLDWTEISGLEKKFSAWEWKYGRKIPFEYSVERRFAWGGLEVQFHVIGGKIEEVKVYSDAMEELFSEQLEMLWKGCRYIPEKLIERLEFWKIDSVNEFQIKQDIRTSLLEEFHLRDERR